VLFGEVARVREHLRDAEGFARSQTIAHLSVAQRMARALLLDELARYRDEGVFPKNDDSPSPRPAFIDAHGTRCAMAHLMELGGAGELVAEVARENNHAYVEELARDARVVAWLRAAGLTVEEAARIQPEYCHTPADCLCYAAYDPRVGLFEGTLVDQPDAEAGAYVRVDVIHRQSDPILPFVTVGDVLSVSSALVPASGTRVLLTHSVVVAAVTETDTLGTKCLAAMNAIDVTLPAVTKAEAIALLNGDYKQCIVTLNAKDPAWNVKVCEGCAVPEDPPRDASVTTTEDAGAPIVPRVDMDDGGCAVASSSPASVSVLLAVLSALAVRRAARRRV
jgi:hypothetical protein